jgi:hypothetical protein
MSPTLLASLSTIVITLYILVQQIQDCNLCPSIETEMTSSNIIINAAATASGNNDTMGTSLQPARPYLRLTGSNFAEIPSNSSLQLTEFTISVWFRTNMKIPFGTDIFIVKKGELGLEDPGANLNYGISITPSETLRAGFESSNGTNYYIQSRSAYNNYQWHQVVATYDGSVLRLYVDGVQAVKNIITQDAVPDNTGSDPLRIGARSSLTEPSPRDNFVGNIDEVRIWNRALTDAEIEEGYKTGRFTMTGQVVYLPFGS